MLSGLPALRAGVSVARSIVGDRAHILVRAPFVTHCALRVDVQHCFGQVIATRLHACCARLHSGVRAARPRKAIARRVVSGGSA